MNNADKEAISDLAAIFCPPTGEDRLVPEKNVLSRLCALGALVSESVFKSDRPADCFCGGYRDRHGYQYSGDVLEFIEKAVATAIAEAKKPVQP